MSTALVFALLLLAGCGDNLLRHAMRIVRSALVEVLFRVASNIA